jgi:hypothetical protein
MPIRRFLTITCTALLVLALAPQAAFAAATQAPASGSTPANPVTRHVLQKGTAAYRPIPSGNDTPTQLSTEIPRFFGPEAQGNARVRGPGYLGPNRSFAADGGSTSAGVAPRAVQPKSVPPKAVEPNRIIRNGPQLLTSFDGLNHRDQRTANGGNQFSIEPPDQGLCVGAGHVVEALNDVFRVYGSDGSGQTGVVDLNSFFGYPAQIDRTTGLRGPVVTDPSCLYDPTTRSFFLTVLTLEVVPTSGEFTGDNHLDIAVSKDPTATWNLYSLDVTDDGTAGTPVHPNCPCIGDYPHIGVDSRGFYLTTNEYSFFGPEFNSAQIYAFSKRALARSDADVLVTQFDTTAADAGLNGFTIWPAQSPTVADYSSSARGTEFFLSSNAAEEATGTPDYISNSIVTWSLTNTASLDSRTPNPRLANTRVAVDTYSLPPPANQKAGPVPLAECLNQDACATVLLGGPDPFKPNVEGPLDSNDTRMQQVSYVNGRLVGALDTAVTISGKKQAGIAWYIVQPKSDRDRLRAALADQGQFGLANNNVIYPAIGVNSSGRGVMAFTLVGDGYFPSAAYAAFDTRHGAGSIFLAKAGVGPQDGFSEYQAFANPGSPARPRWGDYGATAVSGSNIWIASEYIAQTCTLAQYTADPFGSCGGTRTALANWATRLSLVAPSFGSDSSGADSSG